PVPGTPTSARPARPRRAPSSLAVPAAVALPFASVLRAVGAEAARLGIDAYAVGGAVRDARLGRPTTDVDVVAVGGTGVGMKLAEATARALGLKAPTLYPAFGTAALTIPADRLPPAEADALDGWPRLVVEFVGARRESYRADSRKPVVEDGSLADDLARR